MLTVQLYELFEICYPHMFGTQECIMNRLSRVENHFVLRKQGERLVGAAVINKNTILMLCVLPELRKQGMGSDILKEAEEYIRCSGYSEVQLCDGEIYITPGAPLYEGNKDFLEKRGYVHTWGEDECVDMMMELKHFPEIEYSVGDTINGITYKWAELSERECVIDCAYQALPEFAKYYKAEDLYKKDNGERVLAAIKNVVEGKAEVCGVLLVDAYGELPESGTVGCTSVRPACAGQGIASNMVRLGTKALLEAGCKSAYLTYTYTDIVHMYARSGYEICMKYFMGKKRF